MKNIHSKELGIGLLLIVLMTTSCNMPMAKQEISVDEWVATYEEQTRQASIDGNRSTGEENTANQDVNETIEPTLTPTPTVTLTPTLTLTPTPSKPMVSVSVDTNCRTGPGKIYDWIGALLVGEQAEVVGVSMDGQYWVVKNPDQAGECWLWGNYATVTGSTANLQQYITPPTPTPEFTWEGTWTTFAVPSGGGSTESYPMTVTINGQTFTGIMDLGGGSTAQLTGTISSNNMTVSGTWTSPSWPSGSFVFYALGINQFNGNGFNGSQVFGWCGGKNGAGQPSQCYMP